MSGPREHLRRPPTWLLAASGAGAAGLLWALAGWDWTVPGVAMAVAVVVTLSARVVGAPTAAGRSVDRRPSRRTRRSRRPGRPCGAVVDLGRAARTRRPRARRGPHPAGPDATGQHAGRRRAGPHRRGRRRRARHRRPRGTCSGLSSRRGRALFTDAGRAALSAAYSAPDCPAALRAAGSGVVDASAYPRVERDSIAVLPGPPAAPTSVDRCAVRWRATLDELLNGREPETPDRGCATTSAATASTGSAPAAVRTTTPALSADGSTTRPPGPATAVPQCSSPSPTASPADGLPQLPNSTSTKTSQ